MVADACVHSAVPKEGRAMCRASAIRMIVVAFSWILAVPSVWAQQASGIAGLVRDTSGAVLPGVTVEAASPALIEKVRTVVTDGQGRYNITDLRSGTYSVTFSLPGFNTLKREGLQLTAGFTAAVNVDMQVGAIEETVTVNAASPLVDVRNVRQQRVISDQLLDALPVGQKSMVRILNVTRGFSAMPDVGGSRGTYQSNFPTASFRGKANMNKTTVDGMRTNTIESTSQSGYFPNSGMVEEVTLETAAGSAESTAAGAVVNFVPKDGGNTFKGSLWGLFGDNKLQSDNLSDALRARGLSTVNKILDIWDHGGSFGGPIRKDRIWFLTAHRWEGIKLQLPGVFYNQTQGTPFYTPDPGRPGDRDEHFRSHAARVTWQVSPRNKVSGWADVQENQVAFYAPNVAPEALLELHLSEGVYQTNWSSPVTSRLLLDAGASFSIYHWPVHRRPGVGADDISIVDLQRGFRYNAAVFQYGGPKISNRFAQRFSVSYVTGSHALKAGMYTDEAFRDVTLEVNGDVAYRFLGAVPAGVDQYATPYRQRETQKADLGLYVQDQWSFSRLTLNVGLRLDYFNAYVPEQHVPAGPWVPARDFAPVHGVPEWTDVNPRLGVAYDLFGNGRTALKTFIGRYMGQLTATIGNANNPMVTSVNTVQRTW